MAFNPSIDTNNWKSIQWSPEPRKLDGQLTELMLKLSQWTAAVNRQLISLGTGGGGGGGGTTAGSNYWPTSVGGSVNAITLSNSPALTSLVNGNTFTFPTLGANTGAATCQVDGLTAYPIVTPGNTALTGSELRTPLVTLFYANSKFYLAWTWSWWMPT